MSLRMFRIYLLFWEWTYDRSDISACQRRFAQQYGRLALYQRINRFRIAAGYTPLRIP